MVGSTLRTSTPGTSSGPSAQQVTRRFAARRTPSRTAACRPLAHEPPRARTARACRRSVMTFPPPCIAPNGGPGGAAFPRRTVTSVVLDPSPLWTTSRRAGRDCCSATKGAGQWPPRRQRPSDRAGQGAAVMGLPRKRACRLPGTRIVLPGRRYAMSRLRSAARSASDAALGDMADEGDCSERAGCRHGE
jgi:hypothetical protein